VDNQPVDVDATGCKREAGRQLLRDWLQTCNLGFTLPALDILHAKIDTYATTEEQVAIAQAQQAQLQTQAQAAIQTTQSLQTENQRLAAQAAAPVPVTQQVQHQEVGRRRGCLIQ